jgi:RNA-directed DNA polymerase
MVDIDPLQLVRDVWLKCFGKLYQERLYRYLRIFLNKPIEDLARMFNPVLRGWINYYGKYYKSELYATFQTANRTLSRWAERKYKKLRRHRRRATHWLGKIAKKEPNLFVHWTLGVVPATE